MSKLTEKQIEDVFTVYYDQLIEPGLKLVDRQKAIKAHGVRFDLVFEDQQGRTVILELKRDAIAREDIGQIIQYAGIVKDCRVILAAPIIPSSIKKSFERYGIQYLEFNIKVILDFLDKLKGKPIQKSITSEYALPTNVIKEPLSNRKLVDGNIAFKVTYNDKNWNGLCSSNIADYNFKNRTWCKIQSGFRDNCQGKHWANKVIKKGEFPCMDAGALSNTDPKFYAGHFHGPKHDNEPIRALNIKQGKLAVFTSREPGEPESERFIFFIGIINYIEEVRQNGEKFEIYHCDPKTGLYFEKSYYPKFWKYYRNPNNPQKFGWNTGLFRYLNDKQMIDILESIISDTMYNTDIKSKANQMLFKL
jgi:hypothetical protein